MRKIIAFEWISLDGVFDADPEYFGKWFLPFHSNSRASIIKKTIEGAEILLFGKNTYEMLAPYWSEQKTDENGPANALNSLPKYVVSTTLKETTWQNTEKIIAQNVKEEITKLKQSGEGYILISGSATLVAWLIEEGLLDEFRLLIHPYIMKDGRRLFENMPETKLECTQAEELDLGVIMSNYQVKKN